MLPLLRRCVWSVAILAVAAPLFAQSTAQPKTAANSNPKAESRTLITRDSLSLAITYWPSRLEQDAPVVVLLHMENGNRLDWPESFTSRLQDAGFAVITADLRGHGQSKGGSSLIGVVDVTEKEKPKTTTKKGGATVESGSLKPNDYVRMADTDLEAVKQFIYEEHQQKKLNMRKLAIVGCGFSASIAAAYAAIDWDKKPHPDGPTLASQTPRGQDVRALVLISPGTVPKINLPQALGFLKNPLFNVAFLVCVGEKDKADKGQAEKLYDQLITPIKNKDRMYFEKYKSPYRGTNLFGRNLKIEDHLAVFLEKHLMELTGEEFAWRDRESRVGKKRKPD